MNNVLKFANKAPGGPVADGTQPPHDGGMEARVAKLEVAVEYIQRDVGEIKADLKVASEAIGELRGDVSVIKERLSHTPTKLEMWCAVAAVIATVGGGLLWIVQQYLGPILAKAAGG